MPDKAAHDSHTLLTGSVALVTGGAGFIGSHLCARLAESGVRVHVASRRDHAGSPDFRYWKTDLSDFRAAESLVEAVRPDYIFHLASHVMGSPDLSHLLPTFQGNLQTTVNLLTAVAQRGACKRLVMAGSFMEPRGEPGDTTPTSPYAAAKWASSAYVRLFQSLYKVPVTTARVFMVYGPAQQDQSKLIPYVIRCLLKGEPPRISNGQRMVDWVYVSDVVDGMLRLAACPDAVGRVVDIGTGRLISTVDLVRMICRVARPDISPDVGAIPDRPMEPTGAADVEETRRLIDWTANVRLEDGLRQTFEWFSKHMDSTRT